MSPRPYPVGRERDHALELYAERGRAFDVLRKQHDALIDAVLRAGNLPDARIAAERARLALQPMPAVPLELHDELGAVESRGAL